MTETLPAPLVPAEVDLRDFPFTPLFRSRLFASPFHSRSSDAEWRAGMTLWLKSWDQTPAGSLPDDDVELCRLADLGRDLRGWRKIRAGALLDWIKCCDGRLYHPVVAESILNAWAGKEAQRQRTAKAREIRRQQRRQWQETEAPAPTTPTGSVTETVTASKREGEGEGDETGKKESSPSTTETVAGPARPGAGAPDPAVAVIAAFDEARARVFGAQQRRPWPHSHDLVYARRFLAEGADVALCHAVFEAQLRGQLAQGRPPPETLKWMERPLAAALAESRRAPAGAAASDDPDMVRWRVRLKLFLEQGDWHAHWGFPPTDPATVVPRALLAELKPQLEALRAPALAAE